MLTMQRRILIVAIIISFGVIPLLIPVSEASAGELYSFNFGGSRFEVGRRSAYSSSGGWFGRANYGSGSVHRARLSTAAARQTNPRLTTVRSSGKSHGYQRTEIQRLIKEKRREQQEYKKLVRAYERELKQREKALQKQKREQERKAQLAKRKYDREQRLLSKSSKGSFFGSSKESEASSDKKGLSFWQRMKRAIFG